MNKNLLKLSLVPISLGVVTFGLMGAFSGVVNETHSAKSNMQTNNPLSTTTSPSIDIEKNILQEPDDFRQLESLRPKSNESNSNEWSGTYNVPDWKKIFDPELSYYHARKYGWTNLEEYENYIQARLELVGGSSEITFASFQEHDWIAWHHAPGGTLSTSYNDGVGSDVRPTWTGAENVPKNKIDNSIPWYLYDRGAKIFAFDNNNLENAFKRLQWLDRIIPTEVSEITNEAYTDPTTNQKSYRNYYLVNGEFVSSLDPYANYYYVKDNGSDFVRDSYGWKVLISPNLIPGDNKQKFEKLFSTVINPEIETKDPAWQWNDSRIFRTPSNIDGLTGIALEKALENQRNDSSLLKTDLSTIAYPADYVINEEFRLGSSSLKDDAALWNGLYKLARRSSSFAKMVQDPNTFLPQEIMANGNAKNPFGAKVPWTFTHPWNGGGYNSLWVEDGRGGRKVWKNLHYIMEPKYITPFVLDVPATIKSLEDAKVARPTLVRTFDGFLSSPQWAVALNSAKEFIDNGPNGISGLSTLLPYIKIVPNPEFKFDEQAKASLLSSNTPMVLATLYVGGKRIFGLSQTSSKPWVDAYEAVKDQEGNFKLAPVEKGFEYMVRKSANGEMKFYGNYMHIFPGTADGLQWFEDLTDEYNRFGY